jgi:ribosomal protein L16 Arg81 hydroxylase
MKGVMVENHFDGERNFLTVLGGERRYILSHPNQCDHMALFPPGHPSARHSAVDWSDPDLEAFPQFAAARGNEVVLQAGDSLFVPSLWFHTIISLSLNMQCNTRSGLDPKYFKDVEKCGYDVM